MQYPILQESSYSHNFGNTKYRVYTFTSHFNKVILIFRASSRLSSAVKFRNRNTIYLVNLFRRDTFNKQIKEFLEKVFLNVQFILYKSIITT